MPELGLSLLFVFPNSFSTRDLAGTGRGPVAQPDPSTDPEEVEHRAFSPVRGDPGVKTDSPDGFNSRRARHKALVRPCSGQTIIADFRDLKLGSASVERFQVEY
jgi:hypothetical protein